MADRAHRSYLYAPADRERLVDSALRSEADAVVLDLEDAVAPAAGPAARQIVAGVVAERRASGPRCHVRINRAGDGYAREDLAAAVGPGLEAIRLPKCEEADQIRAVDALLGELEDRRGLPRGSVRVYPLIESARGLVRAELLASASPRVVRLAFGATDYLADLGASGGTQGAATFHARAHLVVLSRAARVGGPVDAVHTDLHDLEGLRRSTRQARRLGYTGRSAIHPRQVAVIHEVHHPSEDEVRDATRILAGASDASVTGSGTAVVDGRFVDAAVVARARRVLDALDTTP